MDTLFTVFHQLSTLKFRYKFFFRDKQSSRDNFSIRLFFSFFRNKKINQFCFIIHHFSMASSKSNSMKSRSDDFYMFRFRTSLCKQFEKNKCMLSADLCENGKQKFQIFFQNFLFEFLVVWLSSLLFFLLLFVSSSWTSIFETKARLE